MTDLDLEQELAAMFERRASDIRTAPRFEFSPPEKARTRRNLHPIAAAAAVAAVVVAAGGTVIGIRLGHHPAPGTASALATPASTHSGSGAATTNPTCSVVPAARNAAYDRAIAQGTKVNLDHPNNAVVSVNGASAEYLAVQSTPNTRPTQARYGQWTLALFKGAEGQNIVAAPAGTPESPIADPSGAVTPDWITFGLAHPQQNGGYFKLELFNRRTRSLVTVDQIADAQYQAGWQFIGTPVIYDGGLYYLQGQLNQPSTTVLHRYQLDSGTRSGGPAPDATSVFNYGNGLALIDAGGATVVNHLGTPLPAWLLQTMQGGSDFTYAGPLSVTGGQANIGWIGPMSPGGGSGSFSWASGDATAASVSLGSAADRSSLPTGAFVGLHQDNGSFELADSRRAAGTGQTVEVPLPKPYGLIALIGPDLLFGANGTKDGASQFLLVPVASLPQPSAAGC